MSVVHQRFLWTVCFLCCVCPACAFLDDAFALVQQLAPKDPGSSNPMPGEVHDKSVNAEEDTSQAEVDNALEVDWDSSADAASVYLHTPGTGMVSGAFAFTAVTSMLNELFADTEKLLANSTSDERDAFFKNKNNGLKVRQKQVTDGSNDYFVSEMTPGCAKHTMFGDDDCTLKFGQKGQLHGGVHIEAPVGKGAIVNLQMKTSVKGHGGGKMADELAKKHSGVNIECAACGKPCKVKVGMKTFTIDSGKCPLAEGFHDYWTQEFKVADNFITRSIDFETEITLTMTRVNKVQIFKSTTTIATYGSGSGGAWVHLDE